MIMRDSTRPESMAAMDPGWSSHGSGRNSKLAGSDRSSIQVLRKAEQCSAGADLSFDQLSKLCGRRNSMAEGDVSAPKRSAYRGVSFLIRFSLPFYGGIPILVVMSDSVSSFKCQRARQRSREWAQFSCYHRVVLRLSSLTDASAQSGTVDSHSCNINTGLRYWTAFSERQSLKDSMSDRELIAIKLFKLRIQPWIVVHWFSSVSRASTCDTVVWPLKPPTAKTRPSKETTPKLLLTVGMSASLSHRSRRSSYLCKTHTIVRRGSIPRMAQGALTGAEYSKTLGHNHLSTEFKRSRPL